MSSILVIQLGNKVMSVKDDSDRNISNNRLNDC